MSDPAILFRALADPTRLKMLALIRQHGELCVCDLEHALGITQSKASRHLRYLLNARLLDDRREAVWIYYRLSKYLSAAQLAVLDSVPDLLDQEDMRQLTATLNKWLEDKRCGTVRPKPTKELMSTEVK